MEPCIKAPLGLVTSVRMSLFPKQKPELHLKPALNFTNTRSRAPWPPRLKRDTLDEERAGLWRH